MYKYHCLNPISNVGLEYFPGKYENSESLEDSDVVLVRSANMHEMQLPKNVVAVARAGAGVNNIPLEDYAKEGVVVFNTPGANANGVKEMVIAGMLLASRDIVGGIEWLEKQEATDDIAKLAEKKRNSLQAVKSVERNLELSVLEQSVLKLQMLRCISEWMFTDMTHLFLLMRHGIFQEVFITSMI